MLFLKTTFSGVVNVFSNKKKERHQSFNPRVPPLKGIHTLDYEFDCMCSELNNASRTRTTLDLLQYNVQ